MKISISKREYSQFYIYDYFYGPRRIIRLMRMYMGPTMAVIGLFMFYSYSEQINIYFMSFMLAYGIFYTIKPMIMVMAYKPNDESFTYTLQNFNLHIKDRVNEGDINLKKNRLIENKKYFYVKLETGQSIFFPKDKLDKKKIQLFNENMLVS